MTSPTEKNKTIPTEDQSDDDSRVDDTLIIEFLALSPLERLEWHDQMLTGILELRNAFKQQTD